MTMLDHYRWIREQLQECSELIDGRTWPAEEARARQSCLCGDARGGIARLKVALEDLVEDLEERS